MQKIFSFVESCVAFIKGDEPKATALKIQRKADTIFNAEIAAHEAQLLDLVDIHEQAQERYNSALVNKGVAISSREDYMNELMNAYNNVTTAMKEIDEKEELIVCLKAIRETISK